MADMPYRLALVTLRRNKRRARLLAGPNGALFDVSTPEQRDALDAIVADCFAAGWKSVEYEYLYPSHSAGGGGMEVILPVTQVVETLNPAADTTG